MIKVEIKITEDGNLVKGIGCELGDRNDLRLPMYLQNLFRSVMQELFGGQYHLLIERQQELTDAPTTTR